MKEVALYGTKAAGRVALVDDEDYPLVRQYKWYVWEKRRSGRNSGPYAVTTYQSQGRTQNLRMHNLVAGYTNCDHANGNGLDNRRNNLRPISGSQNRYNERPQVGRSSQFKGVYWDRQYGKWRAQITTDGKRRYLGSSEDEEAVAKLYDEAAYAAWGERAWLNFPQAEAPRSIPHRKRPCGECPWRRDTPSGVFSARRYEALRETSGKPGAEAPLGAPFFACHKSPEGREEACAGWLAVCGTEHLGVRMAVLAGRLEPEDLRPGEGWPALFGSYDEMAATQAAGGGEQ